MFVSKAKFSWNYLFFLFQQSRPVLRDSWRPVTVSSCLCLPHWVAYCLGGPLGTSKAISEWLAVILFLKKKAAALWVFLLSLLKNVNLLKHPLDRPAQMGLLYNPACHQGRVKTAVPRWQLCQSCSSNTSACPSERRRGCWEKSSWSSEYNHAVLWVNVRVAPLITSYIEHVSANVNTVLTPKPKHITITTGSPMCSKMCPLKYFSRSGNGFLLSHSAFISSSDYEHALWDQLCHALSVWLWAGYLNILQI